MTFFVARHDLLARKSLGQHFLCDLNLTRKIASLAGDLSKGCTVFLKLAPAPAGLTRALLGTDAKKIIAIEKDRRCIVALQDVIGKPVKAGLEVIEGDAQAKTWISPNSPQSATRYCRQPALQYWHGIANRLAQENIDEYKKSHSDVPTPEVADRLAAEPGSKTYGRLSVIAQFCWAKLNAYSIFPPTPSLPPPEVDSAVVHLTPRKNRPKDVAFKAMGSASPPQPSASAVQNAALKPETPRRRGTFETRRHQARTARREFECGRF